MQELRSRILNILYDGLWHTTHPERFKHIIASGAILPEPDIPDSERWKTERGKEFKEEEIKFHYMVRKPVIKLSNNCFTISPEVLINSIHWNIHFWLLEETSTAEQYKARQSDYFLNKISNCAKYAGYYEVNRNVYLENNGEKLGDIDLILRNDRNHFLLIEGKNERLPLDVYFGSYQDTLARYKKTKAWEAKVDKRNNYIKEHYQKLNISSDFKYVIISDYPEVLSHFSKYLVLSIYEFEQWANWGFPDISFQNFYSHLYSKVETYNDDFDINKINNFGYTIFKVQD